MENVQDCQCLLTLLYLPIKSSGVARPVKMGGQAVGNAVFQVGKELWRLKRDVNTFIKSRGDGGGTCYYSGSAN